MAQPAPLALLRESVIYETVSSLKAGGECITMPLGVWRRGDVLEATLYPGSRAHRLAESLECVVAALPADPLDVARILLGEAVEPVLEGGLCCPVYAKPYIIIEAVVGEVRRLEGGFYRIILEPRKSMLHSYPEPFTRLASCLVELLVAYTRIRYWRGCGERLREYQGLGRCLDLLERRSVGEYRRYYSLVKRLVDRLVEPCLRGSASG